MTDASGFTSWTYDANGHVLQRTANVGGTPLATQYSYGAGGNLATMTLPSGKVIGYSWSNGRVTALSLNGSPLVSAIAYQPFAGPVSWTFANGETAGRAYDLDGRLVSDPVETIGYDNASRVSGWTLSNLSVSGGSMGYGYDALGRVSSYTGTGGPVSYAYDANGNRSSQTANGTTTTYTIDPASNRVTQATAGGISTTFQFDANGSRIGQNNLVAFTHDAAGRLSAASGASSSATYTYDGLGRRGQKVVSGASAGTTSFAYYDDGKMLGEYAGSGQGNMETVYLGDMPVALLQSGTTYYIHADYRNAPRQLDNGSAQAVWNWNPTPFGDNAPNSNPSSLSTSFNWNARFPGQYLDVEAGTAQNFFRDYELATGRYLETDPIGLAGGINTYGYVGGNPVGFADPSGLQAINWKYTAFQWQYLQYIHLNRNQHNSCPCKEPGKGGGWHQDIGVYSSKYRDAAGDECAYDSSGNLLPDTTHPGIHFFSPATEQNYSFNYGPDPITWDHIWWDVLPSYIWQNYPTNQTNSGNGCGCGQ